MPKSKTKLTRAMRRSIEQHIRKTQGGAMATRSSTANTYFSASTLTTGFATTNSVIGGSVAPLTTLPEIGPHLYVAPLHLYPNDFHIRVWREMNPGMIGRYTNVARLTEVNTNTESKTQLAFFEQEDHDKFVEWMSAYLGKFGQYTNECFPPPVDGFYPNSHSTPDNPLITNYDKSFNEWVWILRNCDDEVRGAGRIWFFKSETDRTLFVMAHT